MGDLNIEMGPDPARAYYWPPVNKRPTRVLFDPIWRDFSDPGGQKIGKFDIFRGKFTNSNPKPRWLTRPDPSQIFLTQTEDIFFDPKRRNWKIWEFLRKFSKPRPKPKMADPTRPNPGNKKLTQLGSKLFDRSYHYQSLNCTRLFLLQIIFTHSLF